MKKIRKAIIWTSIHLLLFSFLLTLHSSIMYLVGGWSLSQAPLGVIIFRLILVGWMTFIVSIRHIKITYH